LLLSERLCARCTLMSPSLHPSIHRPFLSFVVVFSLFCLPQNFKKKNQDGYAVRASDPAGSYPVAFAVEAGADPAARTLPEGAVAYITTGAPLPAGADAVVQVEDTEAEEEGDGGGYGAATRVRILKPAPRPGADVRAVGSDVAAGEAILRAGDVVGPAELGLAATAGVASLRLHARPLVAVLSTGDELTDAGGAVWGGGSGSGGADPRPASALAPGKVFDANRPLLLGMATAAGAAVLDLGIIPDGRAAVDAALNAALDAGADVILSTGGVSMGSADVVKPALEALGDIHFGRCRMKPGKPLTFATLARRQKDAGAALPPVLAFGLPGNPASAAVTFSLVVGPALRALGGWAHPRPRRVHAALAGPIKLDPERPEYHRAVLHWEGGGEGGGDGGEGGPPLGLASAGGFVATSTGGQISSRLGSVRGAAALLELPARAGTLAAGKVVSALVVGDVGGMPVPAAVAATPGIE
jgi:gephyrin